MYALDDRTNSLLRAHQWLYCFGMVLLGVCVMYVREEVLLTATTARYLAHFHTINLNE